ncbi:hypothetical protein ACH5RR_003442 [Cinchona calisaya]|uniref:Uncharacterized protein n=1 Tax=Cinchona calisaya TaxID=153742 RepID=A0ABD3AV60_9GENT
MWSFLKLKGRRENIKNSRSGHLPTIIEGLAERFYPNRNMDSLLSQEPHKNLNLEVGREPMVALPVAEVEPVGFLLAEKLVPLLLLSSHNQQVAHGHRFYVVSDDV